MWDASTGLKLWSSWLANMLEKLAQVAMSYPTVLTDNPRQVNASSLFAPQQTSATRTKPRSSGSRSYPAHPRARREEFCNHVPNGGRNRKRNGGEFGPVPRDSNPGDGPRYSRVGASFRWIAENGPDLDVSETGYNEPWMAPGFIDNKGRLAKRGAGGLPNRLTTAQTERVIRRAETLFACRFEYVLRQVEIDARITLGTNGKVPFPLANTSKRFFASPPTLIGSA